MKILESLGLAPINPGACIGGDWTQTTGQGLISSINPTNNQTIAQVQLCSADDYEEMVLHAKKAQWEWRMVPAPERGEVIRRIGLALREHKDALGSLVTMETGKLKEEGDGEVQEAIDMADFAVGQSRMLYGKSMQSERPRHRMLEQWQPLGLVGVITAFNFPVAVWAWNAFIAAICGNGVIWKPSSKSPLCALALQHICNQVFKEMGQTGIFSVYLPQAEDKELILRDKRIPLVSFTGSTPVGRHVAELLAQRLGRSLLELSGNNAIIVDETANLDLAVKAILFGAIGTTGQRCTTTRRVIVQDAVLRELTGRLTKAYAQVRIGDPLQPDTLMGPVIDGRAKEDFIATIQEIEAQGGKILFGGKAIEREGNFVQPTLVMAQRDHDYIRRENFMPILYLLEFTVMEEAIAINNETSHGLSSAIFTQDINHEELFLSAAGSDCGIANVNIGTSGAEIGGAFGGEKDTGGGREAGSDAWKAYMRRQTNTINFSPDLPLAQGITFDL